MLPHECFARQLEEVLALSAVYPEEGAVSFSNSEQAVLRQVKDTIELGPIQASERVVPEISGTVTLPGCAVGGSPLGLRFELPHLYPQSKPKLQVLCSTGRADHEALSAVVKSCVEENMGGELLLMVLEDLKRSSLAQPAAEDLQGGRDSRPTLKTPSKPVEVACRLIWFHHIKSITKRKQILSWAHELSIHGFSKPGFPGVIVCEGRMEDVQEYYSRLRSLRWQAITVRAETSELATDQGVDSALRFQGRFQELGEGDMDVLASACRAAGLEQLFLSAMKL